VITYTFSNFMPIDKLVNSITLRLGVNCIVTKYRFFAKIYRNLVRMNLLNRLKGRWPVLLLLIAQIFLSSPAGAQSGLQHLDEHILEGLATGRTDGQTHLWRFVSNANNYVDSTVLYLGRRGRLFADVPGGSLSYGCGRGRGAGRRDGICLGFFPAIISRNLQE